MVEKGKADGCYVNTAGVGLIAQDAAELGVALARPGDAIIVSGSIGDHGVTIMLARGELDIEADVQSDTAPLNGLVAGLLAATDGVRALRDATRGGVATILNEIAKSADVGVLVREDAIPVRTEVRGASELLGIDPMYVACEGRLVAVVDGRRGRPRARGAARAPARRRGGHHRPRHRRAARHRPAQDRLRRHQDRRHPRRRPPAPHLLTPPEAAHCPELLSAHMKRPVKLCWWVCGCLGFAVLSVAGVASLVGVAAWPRGVPPGEAAGAAGAGGGRAR